MNKSVTGNCYLCFTSKAQYFSLKRMVFLNKAKTYIQCKALTN